MLIEKWMKSVLRTLLWWGVASCTMSLATQSFAQEPSSYHVFPYVSDGADGLVDRTVFVVTRSEGTASCELSLYGVEAGRLSVSPNFSVGGTDQSDVWVASTIGSGSVQTGYAALSCDNPVTAYVAYVRLGQAGLSSLATAHSSQGDESMELTGFQAGDLGIRLAFSVANDSEMPNQYQIRATTGAQTVVDTTRALTSKSSEWLFLDELTPLDGGTVETPVLSFTADAPIHVTGLQFVGDDLASISAVELPSSSSNDPESDPLGVEGLWSFTFVVTSVAGQACSVEEGELTTEEVSITYDPEIDAYSLDSSSFNSEGTVSVSGNTIAYSGTFPEDGGTTSRSMTMNVVAPGLMEGVEMWTWSNSGGVTQCTDGNSSVEGILLE